MRWIGLVILLMLIIACLAAPGEASNSAVQIVRFQIIRSSRMTVESVGAPKAKNVRLNISQSEDQQKITGEIRDEAAAVHPATEPVKSRGILTWAVSPDRAVEDAPGSRQILLTMVAR